MKRDLHRELEGARRRGWSVERTRGSHWRLKHPAGALVITAGTPSCPRSLANLRTDLRRIERRAS